MKNKKIIVLNSLDEVFDKDISNEVLKDSVIVYCRVSTVQQRDENNSLENQMKYGIEYYKKSNIEYKNILVFKETKSGDDYDKEDLVKREMLSFLLSKVDKKLVKHLWIHNLDRLSRNSQSFGLMINDLMYNDCCLYENNDKVKLEEHTDKLMLRVRNMMDEYENEKRWKRFNWGKIEHCKKNKWYGGTYPFGYKNGGEKGKIIIDKENEKYVKKIFELCKEGKTNKEIVEYLHKNNVRSPKTKSGVWNDQTLRNILRSEKYIGKHLVEITLIKGKSKEFCREKGKLMEIPQSIPKIIDEKLFNDVQKITENWNSSKNSVTKTKYQYLIKDIVYCSCGNKMKVKSNNKKSNWKIYYCDYSNKKWRDFDNRYVECGRGKSRFIRLQNLELLVWNEVVKTLKDSYTIKEKYKESVLPKFMDERKIPNKKIKEYKRLIETYLKQINEVKRNQIDIKVELGLLNLSNEDCESILKRYDNKILELEEKINDKKESISKINDKIVWYEWIDDFEKLYSEISNYKSIEERRNFIDKHINKVVIKWNEKNNTHNITIHFNLKIVEDVRIRKDKYVFEIINGKNEKVINNFNHLFYNNCRNNFSIPNSVFKTTPQLRNSFENTNLIQNNSNLFDVKDIILDFKLNIISSKLSKTTHYNSYQQKLYRLIKFLKEERNLGYRRISRILFEKNYRSIRSNKILKHNYIYSIYYKGKIRENRINREFDSIISDFKLIFISKK